MNAFSAARARFRAARSLAFVLFAFVASQLTAVGQEPTNVTGSKPFSIGETLRFKSEVLQENRELNVYLPNGYAESKKTYPVIYLLDGSADEDFIHVAGLVQFGSFSWIEMLPESIVVGIANVDRQRDFTFPSNNEKDQQDLPHSGRSKDFVEMLKKELQPLVEKRYRVEGPRTLIGQSLGGLLATEVLLTQPELFDHYIIVSPSLWWDDESLLSRDLPEFATAKSVFVGVGKEGEVMERLAKSLHEKLAATRSNKLRLWYQYFPELDHGDTLHLAVYAAFKQIFEKPKD